VADRILDDARALAVLPRPRLLDHARPVLPCPCERGVDVLDAELEERRDETARRRDSSAPASVTTTAPSVPKRSCARWVSPILTFSSKPSAASSQATASRTSG
jgi:hypothetical protein